MISFTENGAKQAREILQRSSKENAAVRVFVKSGGCSGYQYGMAVDDRELDGDVYYESEGIRVVVDKMSAPLLEGSQIDWIESMLGGGFSVNNPNATSSCGCGHSFRTDKNASGTGCS